MKNTAKLGHRIRPNGVTSSQKSSTLSYIVFDFSIAISEDALSMAVSK